jgi:trimethylamine--corrinoid protein Co-methyltransferase
VKEIDVNMPALRLLTPQGLQRIYEAALQVLDEVGMEFDSARALDLLEGAGCRVDRVTCRVHFPPELVQESVALIPRQLTYHGRTPEFDVTVSLDSDIYARSPGGCIGYLDVDTGQYRRGTIGDWRQFCTLIDALPSMLGLANMYAGDVPGRTCDVHSMRAVLESQRKCSVHGASTVQNLRYQIEMMLAVRGSREALALRPLVHNMVSPYSPLHQDADNIEQILLSVEYGLPLDCAVMPIVGVSSPLTLAGSLAQTLAEELGTIALIQVARPGHPVAFVLEPVVGNMRTAEALVGAPESALLLGAICQLGTELFRVPTSAIGFDTDGFTMPQTMQQKVQNLIFQVMAGGKLVIGAGSVESIMSLSPVQLAIDDELITIARRWLRGVAVDDESLAVEAISRVGPRGDFLTDDHTVRALRAGGFVDLALAERDSRRQIWEFRGKETLESRARDKAKAILATHEVPPLADEVVRELAAIVSKADQIVAGM